MDIAARLDRFERELRELARELEETAEMTETAGSQKTALQLRVAADLAEGALDRVLRARGVVRT